MPRTKTISASVAEYLDALPEDRRNDLAALRELVVRIWPNATEDMALGMPTFHLDGHPLCAMASQKHFMALYIMPYDLLLAFKNDLMVLDRGKSCIRFKRLDPGLEDLFDRIIKYTGSQLHTSIHYGKAGNLRGSNGRSR